MYENGCYKNMEFCCAQGKVKVLLYIISYAVTCCHVLVMCCYLSIKNYNVEHMHTCGMRLGTSTIHVDLFHECKGKLYNLIKPKVILFSVALIQYSHDQYDYWGITLFPYDVMIIP